MDAPAYYDVPSTMTSYFPANAASSYETYGPLPPHSAAVYGGYEDPSYLLQWSDGLDGYAPAYPSIDKESSGAW